MAATVVTGVPVDTQNPNQVDIQIVPGRAVSAVTRQVSERLDENPRAKEGASSFPNVAFIFPAMLARHAYNGHRDALCSRPLLTW